MTGRYSEDTRVIPPRRSDPVRIAANRAAGLGPGDGRRFMTAFEVGRIATHYGESFYQQFREALDRDDSATVAGLIEGAASVREG